jgi:Transglycosylase SLT domain/SPOR domain
MAFMGLLLASGPAEAQETASPARTETVREAVCRLIETSAQRHALPVSFFTRLIWQESSFRTGAISPAGAQGIAQFMPGTALERGLADPFDPEQAIPKAADLLSDHVRRFGNLGLAAAAYNGGPARVSAWLDRRGGLPFETRDYVARITGRSPEEWADDRAAGGTAEEQLAEPPPTCLEIVALLRRPGRDDPDLLAPVAPWGVQLAGNFSKDRALAAFSRNRRLYAAQLSGVRPMIIGTRLRSRGTRVFYRVRVPAETRAAAIELCDRIRASRGSCVVLPS